MIITISGDAGSGKNTVGEIISKKLHMPLYCIGDMRRRMAEERGMTLAEFNKLGEKEDFTDRNVDEYQRKLGKEEDNFIMIGRTSFYFIPHSKKIYLAVKADIGAERILKDKTRKTEEFSTLKEAVKGIEKRKQSDIKRYKRYYGIDVYDMNHYDLVVDSSGLTPNQAAEKIIRFVKRR